MNKQSCEQKAEEIRRLYNPQDLSPFPYKNVTDINQDLSIRFFPFVSDNIKNFSGIIIFNKTENDPKYVININSSKPETRQNFTLAHELGHYFLHKDKIESEGVIVDNDFFDSGRALFRMDEVEKSQIEKEANHFASALLMPSDLVADAWSKLKDVEACAKVFNVSVSAMSIRLEYLRLL